jgi:P4 family phage/plasmid primase-like protien
MEIKGVDDSFRVEQFKKFYDLLMSNAPMEYKPWFFPCDKGGKNPSPLAILKLDKESKGSWHSDSARLDKDEAIELIKEGYNIGISARNNDALIIGDIDEKEYINQVPKDTLTTISRKRCGRHFFGWDKDGSAKVNAPTNFGELRSNNQYVLSPGSYVAFNLNNEKEKKAFDNLSEEAKNDPLMGYYTVGEESSPREIGFDDLPEFFKMNILMGEQETTFEETKKEYKEFVGEGKYSELFSLKMSDVLGKLPPNRRVGHPLHESDTDANFSISSDGTLAHCWRHSRALNPVQFLCVQAGYCDCLTAGTPHRERDKEGKPLPRKTSKIKGDKEALECAYKEAVKMGLIKEWKNNISRASQIFTPKGQADKFTEIQPLFFDKHGLWWLWSPSLFKWEIVDEVDILNMIEEATGEDVISPKNRTIILNSLKQKGRKMIPTPIKPTWIQFKDTIMDIETGEKFKASPEYFATNPLPWNLNGDNLEATPVMDRIFAEWVGEENVKQLYEILAYCMMPDYPINRLFCFIGAGMNGKSKFLELLRNFVGGENCCTTELDTLLTSRFEITRLHKKLVCMMGETNFNEMSKTSILKKLTGGDLIGFEYKNKNPFDEKNYAKIIIATNNLPTTTDKTIGFYRRWMIIDFPNQFSEAKDILSEIPEEEYGCLALKCSIILKELLQERKFHNEGSIEQRQERYESKSNFLEKFLKETTQEDPNGYITSADFFKRFSAWCKENRHREMSEVSVGASMRKVGIESEKRYFGWLFDGKGGQLRCWVGLKWIE